MFAIVEADMSTSPSAPRCSRSADSGALVSENGTDAASLISRLRCDLTRIYRSGARRKHMSHQSPHYGTRLVVLMCFSPQADLVGGLVICAIGVDAVRHVGQRREFLALAWIPLLLGAHQFIEALVWLWLQGHVPRGIGHVALWAYLLIAFVVLPVFIPLAVIVLEPTKRRKWMMAPFASIGAVIAAVLFAAMVRGPVGVKLALYHLSYSIRVADGFLVVALYVVAVCGPLLLSGYRNVALFGVVNLVCRL